jgi:hypothetical protein
LISNETEKGLAKNNPNFSKYSSNDTHPSNVLGRSVRGRFVLLFFSKKHSS